LRSGAFFLRWQTSLVGFWLPQILHAERPATCLISSRSLGAPAKFATVVFFLKSAPWTRPFCVSPYEGGGTVAVPATGTGGRAAGSETSSLASRRAARRPCRAASRGRLGTRLSCYPTAEACGKHRPPPTRRSVRPARWRLVSHSLTGRERLM